MTYLKVEFEDRILTVRFTQSELIEQGKTEQIGAELCDLVKQALSGNMLLNFENVSLISSTMVGQLFVLRNKCKAEKVELKLCCVTPLIKDVLDVVQLADFVEIYEDEQQAWLAFHQDFDTATDEEERQAALKCLQLAEQGDATAQYEMGIRCDEGRGIAQSATQALAWYQQSAEQGNTDAQFMLGKSHAYGIHVPHDMDQAVVWYRKAADQGHRDAQYVMGMSYQFGIALKENKQEALRWYKLAAEQGHSQAQQVLAPLQKD